MFESFRFPYAVIHAYRKRGVKYALDLALRCATGFVTRDDAQRWLTHILHSKAYRSESDV